MYLGRSACKQQLRGCIRGCIPRFNRSTSFAVSYPFFFQTHLYWPKRFHSNQSTLRGIHGDPKPGDDIADAKDAKEAEEAESKKDGKKALKPSDIVIELDRFIIGQTDAKRAVAIAMRNRWRRHRLDPSLKDEVVPKNILMIGPTGVGKTEIARRLAKIANAPFIKVEATKFTEVGFHGRDVDQIIKDLVEEAINMTKAKRRSIVKQQVSKKVEDQIIEYLTQEKSHLSSTTKDLKSLLRQGELEELDIDIEVPHKHEDLLQQIFVKGLRTTEKKKMRIGEARPLLEEMEADKLINNEEIIKEAITSVEEDGIVFIDEIDKICNPVHHRHGPDASAEGVQRDLLPLIEGCSIQTKHGNVNTDHILFIASGAFHHCKPSDLLSELQGRLPIRVELKDLTEEDMHRILTEPENNLIKQQVALLATENVTLIFQPEAIKLISRLAKELNTSVENIGARRLHAVIEKIVDDISFKAPDLNPGTKYIVTVDLVQEKVNSLMKRSNMKRYII